MVYHSPFFYRVTHTFGDTTQIFDCKNIAELMKTLNVSKNTACKLVHKQYSVYNKLFTIEKVPIIKTA